MPKVTKMQQPAQSERANSLIVFALCEKIDFHVY